MSDRHVRRYAAYKESGVEWLREVPESWALKRHKDCFYFISNRCADSSFLKVGLENIEGKTGRFIPTETEFDGDGIQFKKDDILFGKLRPYLAKVYLAEFRGNSVGDIFVYRCKRNTLPKFARYLMLSDLYIDVINSSTAGAKMPRVSSGFITDLPVAMPSFEEQSAIIFYLDTKTAQIDRQVELLSKKATQYGKLKQSLINETVTRGLDSSVPMKESGVEWIGEVPAHWDVKRFKEIFNKTHTGWTPDTSKRDSFEGENIWVTIRDMDGSIYVQDSLNKISDNAIAEDGIRITPKGSLLFSFKLSIGKIAFAGCDLYTNEAIISIENEPKVSRPEEFHLQPLADPDRNVPAHPAPII